MFKMLSVDVIKAQNKELETLKLYSSPLFLGKQLLSVSPMYHLGRMTLTSLTRLLSVLIIMFVKCFEDKKC